MTLDLRGALQATVTATMVLGLAGCGHGTEPAPVGKSSETLATFVVGAQPVPAEFVLDGVVESVDQATLSAQTPGRVAELLVDVDDHVERGRLLLRLRATEQAAGLEQAQAAVRAAAARDAQARAQFERIRDMYERKVVARTTYDDATTARDAAAAGLAAARAAADAAREGVAYTEVRAPYDGVVTGRQVEAGESVAAGTPLLSIAALDALRVVAEVPQGMAETVRATHQATVYAGAEHFRSSKVTLFPSADPRSGTVRVRVDLPRSTSGVTPGMYAKVGFITGETQSSSVPASAIVERSELRAVYVVSPDGAVALRQVRLGRMAGERVEVLAGLAQGERVAVDPARAGLAARQAIVPEHD